MAVNLDKPDLIQDRNLFTVSYMCIQYVILATDVFFNYFNLKHLNCTCFLSFEMLLGYHAFFLELSKVLVWLIFRKNV